MLLLLLSSTTTTTTATTAATAAASPTTCATTIDATAIRAGDDFQCTPLGAPNTLDTCRAACCASSTCASFSFNEPWSLNATYMGCVHGQNCCCLKSSVPPLEPNKFKMNITSGVATRRPPKFTCKDIVDCNNGGACDVHSGVCACDATWRGETCAELALLPAPFVGNGDYDYARRTHNYTWGGSIVTDPLDGTHHMFASLFLNGTLSDWETKSIVVHMEAKTPAEIVGPYVFSDIVAAPRSNASPPLWDSMDCHNPTVHKIGDEYVVFYIGVGVNVNRLHAAQLAPNLDKAQAIGAAFASSPRGPWTRVRAPLLVADQKWECGGAGPTACGVSNPAIVVNRTRGADGNHSVLMFYRGNQDRGVGVASAPSWRGPYTKSKESTASNGIFRGNIVVGLEDMYVWENPLLPNAAAAAAAHRPGCHMILHQEEQGIENLGAHAFTTDPSCLAGWQLSTPRPSHAYGPEFAWSNGTTTTFGSRERPQVVLDHRSGAPTHLSSGVILKPASGGGWSGASFTVVAPIAV